MIKSHNPYAKALDGLDIPNPVKSFSISALREKNKKKREQGLPSPGQMMKSLKMLDSSMFLGRMIEVVKLF